MTRRHPCEYGLARLTKEVRRIFNSWTGTKETLTDSKFLFGPEYDHEAGKKKERPKKAKKKKKKDLSKETRLERRARFQNSINVWEAAIFGMLPEEKAKAIKDGLT